MKEDIICDIFTNLKTRLIQLMAGKDLVIHNLKMTSNGGIVIDPRHRIIISYSHITHQMGKDLILFFKLLEDKK